MIDRNRVNCLVPNELLEMLDKLDGDNYLLLCHSTKVSEVKSWNLPYKVIGNEWFDKTIKENDKVYVVPDYKDTPITVRCEYGDCSDCDGCKDYGFKLFTYENRIGFNYRQNIKQLHIGKNSEMLDINFCPWCGRRLNEGKDASFDKQQYIDRARNDTFICGRR